MKREGGRDFEGEVVMEEEGGGRGELEGLCWGGVK